MEERQPSSSQPPPPKVPPPLMDGSSDEYRFPSLQYCALREPSFPVPKVVCISKPLMKIGRTQPTDICLDSKERERMISREHAIITYEWKTNVVKIADMKSVNGIFVNTIKVREAELHDGDVIVFGEGGGMSFGSKLKTVNPELQYMFKAVKETRKRKQMSDGLEPVKQEEDERILKRRREEEEEQEKEKQKEREKEKEKEDAIRKELEELRERLKTKEHEEQLLRQQVERMVELEKKLELSSRVKEEEKKMQEASFHEQMALLRDQFDAEKQKLEELKKMKEVMLEEEKKQLEQELMKQKTEVSELIKGTIHRKDLEEEFTCSICQGLMVQATAVSGCGHSFCAQCIEDWLNLKKTCPVCRNTADILVPARNLDNVIEKIVDKLVPEEKKEWQDAKDKRLREQDELNKLQSSINSAKSSNLKFLSIADNWSLEERKIFASGVGRYKGKARVLYCSTTGLTKEYVERCSLHVLHIAFNNVGCTFGMGEDHRDSMLIRRKLLQFINGDP